MKKHVGYVIGLVFLVQNGWGMDERPQLPRSQSEPNLKEKISNKTSKPHQSADTDGEDEQKSEKKPSSTSEVSATHSDEPGSEDNKPISSPAEVKTYTDEDLLKMFRQHQKNADVSVRYKIKEIGVFGVNVILRDGRQYEINLENGEIQYFEKRQTTLDAIKTALLNSISNATDVKFSEGKITYYSEEKGELCSVGTANRNEITKAIEITYMNHVNDVSVAKDETIYYFEKQENPSNISDAIKADAIEVDLMKRGSVVTGAKISINNQIHLAWDGVWLSVLDTSYDGSLAIEAPRIQTIGTVNCKQFYTRIDSAQGGSFINWGNLITGYETKIFSEKIQNIGCISHNSKESFTDLPDLEEITEFRRKNSALLSDDVSNMGKIDVDNIRLANISFSSGGDINAKKVEQSGKGCFIRLGRDINYEKRIADVWQTWINTHYGQNVKFNAQIADLNTPILSLDVQEPIDSEIHDIKIGDTIDVKLTNPNTEVVSMSNYEVFLADLCRNIKSCGEYYRVYDQKIAELNEQLAKKNQEKANLTERLESLKGGDKSNNKEVKEQVANLNQALRDIERSINLTNTRKNNESNAFFYKHLSKNLQFDFSPEQAKHYFDLFYCGKYANESIIQETISLKDTKTNSEVQKLRMIVLDDRVSFYTEDGRKIDHFDAFYLWKLFNECMMPPLIDNWKKKDEETILKDCWTRVKLERFNRVNTCHQLLMKESQNKIEGDTDYQKNSPANARKLSQQLQSCGVQDLLRKNKNAKILQNGLLDYIIDYLDVNEKVNRDNIVDVLMQMVIKEKIQSLKNLTAAEIINQIKDTAWSILFFSEDISKMSNTIRP